MKNLINLFALPFLFLYGCNSRLSQDEAKDLLYERDIDFSQYELYKHRNDPEIKNLFISAGMKEPTKDEELLYVSYDGNLELVKALLEKGANINFHHRSYGDGTPLAHAALSGHVPVLKFLLEKGADPNLYVDEFCMISPLYEAVKNDHVECVRILLEHGARPDAFVLTCLNASTAADLAWEKGNIEIIKLFSQFGSKHVPLGYDFLDVNRIIAPTVTNNLNDLKAHLECFRHHPFSKMTVMECYEKVSLELAIQFGNTDIVKYLLEERKVIPTKEDINLAKNCKRQVILKFLKKNLPPESNNKAK